MSQVEGDPSRPSPATRALVVLAAILWSVAAMEWLMVAYSLVGILPFLPGFLVGIPVGLFAGILLAVTGNFSLRTVVRQCLIALPLAVGGFATFWWLAGYTWT